MTIATFHWLPNGQGHADGQVGPVPVLHYPGTLVCGLLGFLSDAYRMAAGAPGEAPAVMATVAWLHVSTGCAAQKAGWPAWPPCATLLAGS